MLLLITRPKDAGLAMAAALTARGHVPIFSPLLEIRMRSGAILDLDGIQAVLATSANGVRAFAARSDNRTLPLYAVGPQTEEAAREAGFQSVHSANGDAAALAEKVIADLLPESGVLFHAAGSETAGRLSETLKAQGFTMRHEVLYDALPIANFSEQAESALRENRVDGVLLFSPRSAKIFSNLILAASLAANCARLDAFCISAATASALGSLEFARIAVAGNPNQEAMLALLGKEKN